MQNLPVPANRDNPEHRGVPLSALHPSITLRPTATVLVLMAEKLSRAGELIRKGLR